MRLFFFFLFPLPALLSAQTGPQTQFFEAKVRPILVTKCGSCHGDKVQMKGLQLTSKEGIHMAGSVVSPGNVEGSELVKAVRYTEKVKMPPSGKLPQEDIAVLEKWIATGAPWPESSGVVKAPEVATLWSLRPLRKPEVPTVKDASWIHSDIDRFILAKLEEKKITPVADADKYSLLRRITLDLTGLLPTPAEIQAFQSDQSPKALEKVVDRLLASPAYGDAWGRHWLDVTYYADTTGVGRRIPLPEAWRYRDYVIDSFNEDKPYNDFVREQVGGNAEKKKKSKMSAGDSHESAATGFLVLGPWAWFAYDREQVRLDVADLQADLVGRTFLGLTVGCARCHDHKFDPISNKDYYGMVGIFLSTKTMSQTNPEGGINIVPLPETGDSVKQYADNYAAWEKRVAEVEAAEVGYEAERTKVQKRIEELKKAPKSDGQDAEIKKAETELAELKKKSGPAGDRQLVPYTKYMKPRLPYVYAAEDMEFPENARMAVLGNAHQLGDVTPRSFLRAVNWDTPPEITPQVSGRKELADWLASDKNPLTARVYVNRVWHYLFGDGIVATTDNFGNRGELPTHPELLDFLAVRFLEEGWSTKKLIREIVLSHVYQLSSHQSDKANELDADNKLLWRSNRRRMEVEAVRDSLLQVSGKLNPGRGGPSLPLSVKNLHTIAPYFLEDDSIIEEPVKYRRTVYQPIMRNSQMDGIDILNLFDFKDPDQVVGTRQPTTVPTQTLYLMNSPFVREQASQLATTLLQNKQLDEKGRIAQIILTTLNRPAEESDFQQANQFFTEFQAGLKKLEKPPAEPLQEAWSRYCQAILVSSEFLYRR